MIMNDKEQILIGRILHNYDVQDNWVQQSYKRFTQSAKYGKTRTRDTMMPLVLLAALLGLSSAVPLSDTIENMKIDAEGCGRRPLISREIDPLIVGGREVNPPYSWPFICSLQYGGSHICGGTLVKNKAGKYYFVTAAHCVSSGTVNNYRVRCGIHRRTGGTEPNEVVLSLQSLTRHPNYSSSTLRNDIAIFTLSSNPRESNYIQPACIPIGTYTGGETAYVIGWGTLTEGGSAATVLQEASKPIVTDAQCRSAYGTEFDANTMVCAGYIGTGGVDACQGDSGGPMVVRRNGFYELVGVVSWGYGCARPQYPGVYADVHALKSWINTIINGGSG